MPSRAKTVEPDERWSACVTMRQLKDGRGPLFAAAQLRPQPRGDWLTVAPSPCTMPGGGRNRGRIRVALRLADMLETVLLAARDAFAADDRKQIAEVRRMDDVLDRPNTAIKVYLTGLDPEAISKAEQHRIEEILTFTTNLEHACDVVDKNLLGQAAKRQRRNIIPPCGQAEELAAIIAGLAANVRPPMSF